MLIGFHSYSRWPMIGSFPWFTIFSESSRLPITNGRDTLKSGN